MIKKPGLIIVVILLALAVIASQLSTEFDVEQSIVVNTRSEIIHPYVNDLKRWRAWSPWKVEKPAMKIFYGNVTKGIGATQSWREGDERGRLKITASSPVAGIAYDIYFDDSKIPFISAIEYQPLKQGSTKVIWRMHGEIDVPVIGGFTAMYIKYKTTGIYQDGLRKLKQLIESKQ